MKSFVITITSEPKSIACAERCIASMPEYNVEMFDAITPKNDPVSIMEQKGLPTDKFSEIYSNTLNCISAFLSHYSLWERCASDNVEYQIFEHDAVRVGNLPKFIDYLGCISLGQPSYGKYNTPSTIGVNKLVSKKYFPGAHAYRLKPKGAKALISIAQQQAAPTDVFLNLDSFPWLEEYYPWPVIAKDTFTTIQNTNGCRAKHNYGVNYEILRV